MSGHSKFANIAHKKAANDAAKGKIFTRLGKELMIAVKEGGPDVNNNSKLRQVVAKCKAANMPNDTIDRAIKKAASNDMSNYESVTYEGYGPNGTAIIVEALTDNRNRAASNIRSAFTKGGGNVGTPGCVSFMFDNKGQMIVDKEEYTGDADELMMLALDAGADDFNEEEDCYEILTSPEEFDAVNQALADAGVTFASAEVTMIPQTTVDLTSEDDIKKMNRILGLLDEDDDVIRPAILWNDGRTQKETDYLNNEIGKDKLSEYTANIAFAGFTAPKILWMRENEPDNFNKIKKIMLPKDYLAYKLSGTFCTDYSDASGMLLLDVKNKCWSKQMMEICGVSEEQLPKLFESYEVVGTLKEDIAEELGLFKEVKIIAGAGDNAAAAVGTGTVGDGMCNISLGTSGTIFISSKTFGVDSNNALHSFDHADGYYHLMGCMLSAASCNKWWMDEILKTKEYSKEQEGITKLGENHVFYLPYLMGERSPHNDPKARATFIGMSMDTTREEMTQAVLEGVAFGLRDSLEVARSLGIKIERTKICGGGAKSPLWKKIIANVMNLKVDVIESEEGPGYGGAMLAAVGCGEYDSVQEAADQLVKVVDTVEPDAKLVAKYEAKYQQFREIYPALKGVFQKFD